MLAYDIEVSVAQSLSVSFLSKAMEHGIWLTIEVLDAIDNAKHLVIVNTDLG